jgi:hypothetical protein
VTAQQNALEALSEVARGERSLASFAGLGPEELAELLELAIARMKTRMNLDAARVLLALRALDPLNAIFAQYLGLALERAKDVEGALGAYGDQIRLLEARGCDPDALKEGYLLRARVLALAGRRDQAAADLARVVGGFADPALGRELLRLRTALGGAR